MLPLPELLVRRLLRSRCRLSFFSAKLLPAQYTCIQSSLASEVRISCVTTPLIGLTRRPCLRTVSSGGTERRPPLLATGFGLGRSRTGSGSRSGRFRRSSPQTAHCGRRITGCFS